MGNRIAWLAASRAWAIAEAWFMHNPNRAGRRRARALDPGTLSPHLLRDIGLLDAAPPEHGRDAVGRMGQHRPTG
jgi:hypothetical protein